MRHSPVGSELLGPSKQLNRATRCLETVCGEPRLSVGPISKGYAFGGISLAIVGPHYLVIILLV